MLMRHGRIGRIFQDQVRNLDVYRFALTFGNWFGTSLRETVRAMT